MLWRGAELVNEWRAVRANICSRGSALYRSRVFLEFKADKTMINNSVIY
jgi:hypothetical protein